MEVTRAASPFCQSLMSRGWDIPHLGSAATARMFISAVAFPSHHKWQHLLCPDSIISWAKLISLDHVFLHEMQGNTELSMHTAPAPKNINDKNANRCSAIPFWLHSYFIHPYQFGYMWLPKKHLSSQLPHEYTAHQWQKTCFYCSQQWPKGQNHFTCKCIGLKTWEERFTTSINII